MATWDEFENEAPETAALAKARIDATGLLLLASLRADGSPRISPLEPIVHDGRLWLGMMLNSTKAADLRRDGRLCLHTATEDKDVANGDAKLFGVAHEVTDGDEKQRYCDSLKAQLGHEFAPDGLHLFEVDLTGASGLVPAGTFLRITIWQPGKGERVVERH